MPEEKPRNGDIHVVLNLASRGSFVLTRSPTSASRMDGTVAQITRNRVLVVSQSHVLRFFLLRGLVASSAMAPPAAMSPSGKWGSERKALPRLPSEAHTTASIRCSYRSTHPLLLSQLFTGVHRRGRVAGGRCPEASSRGGAKQPNQPSKQPGRYAGREAGARRRGGGGSASTSFEADV